MKLHLRNAQEADKAFGQRIHHKAYYDVIMSQYGEWDTNTQNAYYEQVWYSSPHQIIELDGKPIGCFSKECHRNHIFLSEIQLFPAYQNRGIGTLLIQQLQDESRTLKRPIRLQVLKENRALQLYQRLGFRVIGKTKAHLKMQWKPDTITATSPSQKKKQ